LINPVKKEKFQAAVSKAMARHEINHQNVIAEKEIERPPHRQLGDEGGFLLE